MRLLGRFCRRIFPAIGYNRSLHRKLVAVAFSALLRRLVAFDDLSALFALILLHFPGFRAGNTSKRSFGRGIGCARRRSGFCLRRRFGRVHAGFRLRSFGRVHTGFRLRSFGGVHARLRSGRFSRVLARFGIGTFHGVFAGFAGRSFHRIFSFHSRALGGIRSGFRSRGFCGFDSVRAGTALAFLFVTAAALVGTAASFYRICHINLPVFDSLSFTLERFFIRKSRFKDYSSVKVDYMNNSPDCK